MAKYTEGETMRRGQAEAGTRVTGSLHPPYHYRFHARKYLNGKFLFLSTITPAFFLSPSCSGSLLSQVFTHFLFPWKAHSSLLNLSFKISLLIISSGKPFWLGQILLLQTHILFLHSAYYSGRFSIIYVIFYSCHTPQIHWSSMRAGTMSVFYHYCTLRR